MMLDIPWDGHSEHWMGLEHSMGWVLEHSMGWVLEHSMGWAFRTMDGAGTFHGMGIIGTATPGTKQRKAIR